MQNTEVPQPVQSNAQSFTSFVRAISLASLALSFVGWQMTGNDLTPDLFQPATFYILGLFVSFTSVATVELMALRKSLNLLTDAPFLETLSGAGPLFALIGLVWHIGQQSTALAALVCICAFGLFFLTLRALFKLIED